MLRKRRKTSVERISPPTPPLLTHLVGNNHLPLSRLPLPTRRRTRTTKEVLGTVVDGDGDEAKTPLRQVSTLLPRRKKKISPMSNASTAEGRAILPTSVLRKGTRSQKTSGSLGNLYVDETNVDGALALPWNKLLAVDTQFVMASKVMIAMSVLMASKVTIAMSVSMASKITIAITVSIASKVMIAMTI